MLSCSYLVHSGDTVLIPNLHFETNSESKYQEAVNKGNIVQNYLKGMQCWES